MAHSILIVDDDPDIRANLCDIFSDFGYDVALAPDGRAALNMAAQRSFDVALLDLKMPGMDGLEVYRHLKKLDPGIVAIIVTAYASSQTAKSALADGAWDLLSKPVDLKRLTGLVDESVHRPLVVLVDDDRELCQTMWDVLRENRYRTSIAHDVDEASTLLDKRSFDAAVVDLKLPKGNGGEVLRKLKSNHPDAVAVLITGFPQDVPGGEHPPDFVMTKPLNLDAILRVLQTVEKRSAAHDAAS